ncbi:DUF4129 domain-containing protein [Fibrella sp. HMF5335]|uniref:DUF4129 domain-containing protein n=1 Tax=Fibrella rubiginis TaxID=2817060 RepID=A0A939K0X2_9BACT|nr:DUF4129 domain-containing protein [Fibrella rubiginis]MBO0936547.1 DUF4129 domain-containing protein [Fibrella rubiginis]
MNQRTQPRIVIVLNRLLILLLLCCSPTVCLRAQDSTTIDPSDGKEVIISPEKGLKSDSATSAGKVPDTVTYAAPNDKTTIRVRPVDADKLHDIETDRRYQYGDDVPPTASAWDRFWAWFWRNVRELLRTKAYQNVGQYVLLVAIGALVIWLLYKADVLSNLFPNRSKEQGLGYETLDENIHDINFTDRINEAIEGRSYRLAVRLLYLQTLKRLTDNGLIHWQVNKTNRQYAHELTGNALRPGFDRLTTQFEYVWYGDFPVDEDRFGIIRQQFQEFNQQP